MNDITKQFYELENKLFNTLQNSKEFKDNFNILQIGKESIFADKNFNNHYSIKTKGKNNTFDLDTIKFIQSFN